MHFLVVCKDNKFRDINPENGFDLCSGLLIFRHEDDIVERIGRKVSVINPYNDRDI